MLNQGVAAVDIDGGDILMCFFPDLSDLSLVAACSSSTGSNHRFDVIAPDKSSSNQVDFTLYQVTHSVVDKLPCGWIGLHEGHSVHQSFNFLRVCLKLIIHQFKTDCSQIRES